MARVPEEATLANAALLRGGRLPEDGPVLAIVPGTVAAMHLAWKQHGSGRLPWATLLAPISVEVTRASRRVQASAICARLCPRRSAIA